MKMGQFDETLWVFERHFFETLPDGMKLKSINGDTVLKSDDLDRDHRFGCVAYGLTEELANETGYRNKFLLWKIE